MDVYGLIGNPVGHSVSPPMHEAAYEALEISARYVTFEPAEADVQPALQGAKALGIEGLNVTIPFKEAVLDHVDPAPLAERIGAINTIDFSESPPRGYNTDASGVIRSLDHHDVVIEGQSAVVVGAGGAGRGAAFALADAGASVDIANRTIERAERLASDIGNATAHSLSALPTILEEADILIQATSVGMETDESPVPQAALHANLTVMDAVYAPLETRLLREADDVGAKTIDGGWMLLYQGVEAFEHWRDTEAPIEAMNRALRNALTSDIHT